MEDRAPKTKKIIDQIHKDLEIPAIDLRQIKENLKSHPDTQLEDVVGGLARHKAEVNGLFTIFIEEVWLELLKKIQKNPPGLQQETTRGVRFLTEQSIKSQIDVCKNPDQVADFIMQASLTTFRESHEHWLNFRNNKHDLISSGQMKAEDIGDRAYERYLSVLEKGRYKVVNNIDSGIGTALKTSWAIIKIIPKVYKDQFGEDINPKDFGKIAQNALPLLYALAGANLQVFIQVRREVVGPAADALPSKFHVFSPDKFYFRKSDKGELFLEIEPELLSQSFEVFQPGDFETPTTSCPAIYSMGPSHRNVIAEMYDWVLSLAEKYYLPALEERSS